MLDKGKTPEHDILAWMPASPTRIKRRPSAPRRRSASSAARTGPTATKPGNVWSADKFFVGGEPVSTDAWIDGALPTLTTRPSTNTGRQGKDFSYAIPVQPGLYTSTEVRRAKVRMVLQPAVQPEHQRNARCCGTPISAIGRGVGERPRTGVQHVVPDATGRSTSVSAAVGNRTTDRLGDSPGNRSPCREDRPTIRIDLRV